MKGSTPAADEARINAAIADLLSVDADAHLQKLAACMFPSPSQLPVELVRAALKRGAATVDIRVGNRHLAIRDDGKGIPGGEWLSLACAFDSNRGAAAREEAIAALQSEASPGIGLLAVSLPGSLRILIESAGEDGKKAMQIEAGKVRQLDTCPGTPGTRISILRERGRADAEKKLIRELCAAVPQEIVLNGRKIEKRPLLRRTLARQAVAQGPVPATVAIPARGDVCRIWLLDRGIPWQAFTCASYHGLVFDAALESAAAPPAAAFFNVLAENAVQLYRWLAAHYPSFPEKYQERIEELIFKKARFGGDLHLLSAFAPFRMWRSRQRLSLEEVRRKAEEETLYVFPANCDPGHRLPRHAQALLLTPLQKDFLQNQAGLSLAEPPAADGADGGLSGLFSSSLRKMIRVAAALPRRVKIPAFEELRAEERSLCREMESQWQRQQLQRTPGRPPMPLAVVMIEGRGLLPALRRHMGASTVLQLRRRHPLVRLALRSVRRDPANSELALAALAADIF